MKKLLISSLVAVLMPINALAIDYADGQEHDISTSLNDSILIRNEEYHIAGASTTVNLLTGGSVYNVDVYDTSTFNMFDGSVANIGYYAQSQGTISGGMGIDINITGESSVSLSGGAFEKVYGVDNCSISVSGGQFQGLMFVDGDGYTFEMSGGRTEVIDGSGFGCTTIIDGEVDTLVSNLSGIVEVFGGQINHLKSGDYSNSGLIIIHGTDFNHDYGYISDYSGLLTGTLASGDTIVADFSRFGNAEILLVPEPTTLLLFGLGGLILRKQKSNS